MRKAIRSPLWNRVAAVLVVVALISCRPAHRLGAVSSDVPKCVKTLDCPYGYECAQAQCRRSECNVADPDSTIGPLDCPRGVCEYDDADDSAHGNGTCTAGL